MIEVRNLTKIYGTQKALDDVSFKVNSGEVVGLLGPNGAGKTTALNIITGVLFPNGGQVYVNEQRLDVGGLEVRRKIGYLSENNPLYSPLLVSESLKLAAELKGMTPNEYAGNFDRVVKVAGLRDVLNKPIETLSKGFKQRVGLAQALINNPPILILDEPTEGLDPNQRQGIRQLIQQLGQDHTVLLSTHVMQEVEAICQRVVILNKGRIAVAGTVAEITQAQDDHLELELKLSGTDAGRVYSIIRDRYELSGDDQLLIIKMHQDQVEEFYRLVGDRTSQGTYVTHMKKRQVKLEDVFRKLTMEQQ